MTDKDNKTDNFEQEIREMYKERNTRLSFAKPKNKQSGIWLSSLWLWLLVAAVLFAGLLLFSLYLPLHSTIVQPTFTTVVTDKESTLLSDMRGLSSSAVIIFSSQTVSEKTPLWQDVYLVNKALGLGLVLSSDGWLVTTNQVITDINKNYIVTTLDGKLRPVKRVVKDPAAPFIYLKVEADGLTPTAFRRLNEVSQGSLVVAQGILGQGEEVGLAVRRVSALLPLNIIKNNSSLIKKSEELSDIILLDSGLPDQYLGAPVYSLDNKVIGLAGQSTAGVEIIYPLEIIDQAIDQLFTKGTIERVYLGVNYALLNSVLPFTNKETELPEGGAWLVSTGNQSAVVSKSPASVAGLKANDVILYIEKDRVSGTRSLAYLLQSYKIGTKVNLRVWRSGKEIDLSVTLDKISGTSVEK